MTLKRLFFLLGFALLLLVAPVAYQIDRAARSLPPMQGTLPLPGLDAPVTVAFDSLGIPTVRATHREDAYRALGFLHARDRLFQMDLQRRKASGRLAEVLGPKALAMDRQQRVYRFTAAAADIFSHLPEAERAVLTAYAQGVNALIESVPEYPPEFRFLHYRPEPWQPTDSLLVASGMFQALSDQESEERMLTVMQACLPPRVSAFLTPDMDEYTQTLLGGEGSRRPAAAVPVADLVNLLEEPRPAPTRAALVDPDPPSLGSNNWAVNGSKTADGRAIMADDMHLALGVPNIWYRAHLHYQDHELSGISLPGLPLIVAGSNGHVAWGYTNLYGDVQDLVSLETDPEHPEEYRTAEGWRRFDSVTETILVRDNPPETIQLRATRWGPVLEKQLLGKPVALHWTALDPAAVNLKLLDMDAADSVDSAMSVLNRFGAPPQNVVIADERGHIGWTLTGFIPRRLGMDGSVSHSWAGGDTYWNGYLEPDQLPHVQDPPEGYLATANNRNLGSEYPHIVGHDFVNGYRAYRIRQRLAAEPRLSEAEMLAIQLDTTSEFYEFYRELALSLLTPEIVARDPDLADAAAAARQWNGRMDPNSLGIGLLARWRSDLAQAVFAPFLSGCKQMDADFVYRWKEQETPLRALLRQGLPDIAALGKAPDWQGFLRDVLRDSIQGLRGEHAVTSLLDLPWQRVNTLSIQHFFSRALPLAGIILDMPPLPGACNNFCVKVLHDHHGATERMVISPNHAEDGILQMPGGQSGHPLSPHFRDQQRSWEDGRPAAFLPGPAEHHLTLQPFPASEGDDGRHSADGQARHSGLIDHLPASVSREVEIWENRTQ